MATRREKVVLELEDNFTSGMARAAAAAALLDRNLKDLDGSAVDANRSMSPLGASNGPIANTGRQSATAGREIDRFSGRLRLFADIAAIIGPAFVPIGAVAVPAITGLAAQMGAAAIAGGTAIIAFQGVGDALKAVNKAALEPSAKNLEAAQIAMQNLAPEAAAFVRQIQEMRPAFDALQESAAAGIFPGMSAALTEAQGAFDGIERVLYAVGDAAGDLAEDFAEGLAGPRGQEFLAFIESEVPSALTELGHTVGNLVAGMGELWMAFTPLNRDFSAWLLNASRGFDDWAQGLSQTEGFQEFVAYVRENGPRVADAMGSIGNALLQIVEAAAPMGGPVLQALAAVADVIAAIADSDAGPAIMASVTALALLNRGIATFATVRASSLFAGLGAAAGDATRKMTGMQRATTGLVGALAGLMVVDAAQGGMKDYAIGIEEMTAALLDLEGAGSLLDALGTDLPSQLEGISNSIDRLVDPSKAEAFQDSLSGMLGGIGNEEEFDRAKAQIESLDAALTGLVRQGRVDTAADVLSNLGLSKSQMADLMSLLPGYRDALAGVENQTRLTGEAGAEAGSRAAEGFGEAVGAVQQFRTAITRLNAALEGRASARDYQAALDDFTKSVKENGRTLDRNTEKGRANEEALDAIASTAIKVAENLRGSARVNALTQARKDFVDAAMKLGKTRAQAQELADKLGLLGGIMAKPGVRLDDSGFQAALNAAAARLAALDGRTATAIIRLHTVRTGAGGQGLGFDGYASGGYTGPGHKYEPAGIVHRDEFVFSKEATQGNVAYLQQLHKKLRGYADGGLVQRQPAATTTFSTSQSISFAPATVEIRDPWGGTQRVELIARAAARSEYDSAREFERQMSRG